MFYILFYFIFFLAKQLSTNLWLLVKKRWKWCKSQPIRTLFFGQTGKYIYICAWVPQKTRHNKYMLWQSNYLMCCVHLMNKWEWKALSHASKYRPHHPRTLETLTILKYRTKQLKTHASTLPGDPLTNNLFTAWIIIKWILCLYIWKCYFPLMEPHLFRFFYGFNYT